MAPPISTCLVLSSIHSNSKGEIEPFTDDQAEHVRNLLCDLGVSS